ncbi:hypothetical protein Q9233_002797, partial [Columba guinea]
RFISSSHSRALNQRLQLVQVFSQTTQGILPLCFEIRTVRKEQRGLLIYLGKMELHIECIPTGEIIRVVSRNGERKTLIAKKLVIYDTSPEFRISK